MPSLQNYLDILNPSALILDSRQILPNAGLWVALSDYAVLRVKGPDAQKFLQGQLSCDMAKITLTSSIPGAHCNAKGRIVSLFRIARWADDEFWLRMPQGLIDIAHKALAKYAVFSKVKMEVLPHIHPLGYLGSAPTPTAIEGLPTLAIAAGMSEFWPSHEQLQACKLQPSALGEHSLWQLAHVRQGLPELQAEQSERYLPQELNLVTLGAVSFSKGCFTGQEVIARLHYKGALKKSLIRLEVSSEAKPLAGDEITNAEGQRCGEIVNAVAAPQGKTECLALLAEQQIGQENCLLGQEKVRWL